MGVPHLLRPFSLQAPPKIKDGIPQSPLGQFSIIHRGITHKTNYQIHLYH